MHGECHGHIFMDGASYSGAVSRHRNKPDLDTINRVLSDYADRNVTFFRDGGDALGVSSKAKQLASSYGIDYRTPLFAIHREGFYGGIVGRGFSDLQGYRALVSEAVSCGADFIKIMVSGILSFDTYGELSCDSLCGDEIRELISVVHDDFHMAVMVHVNGDQACRACIESGADSIEHGFFMTEDTLLRLSTSSSIWVPTLSPPIRAIGCGRFPDSVTEHIARDQKNHVQFAAAHGSMIAAGSDAGAYLVPHRDGIEHEVEYLAQCGVSGEDLTRAEDAVRTRFRTKTGSEVI